MKLTATALAILALLFPAAGARAAVTLEEAFPSLSFTRPVDLQHAGDGSNRLFVVEQRGVIYVFDNSQTVDSAIVFLDIQARVDDSANEEGLLGLAFHPDYGDSGYFYVNYTTSSPNRTRISRFSVSATDSNVANAASELVLLTIDRPYSNHNAGQIAFGPDDGYLYITTGDGGSAGDPLNNGQDRGTLLGSILRIDVDNADTGLEYAIPPDNPYADNPDGYREEIWAYGLRNPWRMSFDPATGRLWAGDVGQGLYEEIDIIEKGKNYGWRIMEADSCYNPPAGCDTTGLTLPVWSYDHDLGYSVTGGYVYRGCCVPEIAGKYIYGDYGSGRIWALEYDGMSPPANTEILDTGLNIASFGLDQAGEIYICAFDGKIYRFTGTTSVEPAAGGREGLELRQNQPNPFSTSTLISFSLPESRSVRLEVIDVGGRTVDVITDGVRAAGGHTLEWDGLDGSGRKASPGVYFVRIEAGGFNATRKMVLAR